MKKTLAVIAAGAAVISLSGFALATNGGEHEDKYHEKEYKEKEYKSGDSKNENHVRNCLGLTNNVQTESLKKICQPYPTKTPKATATPTPTPVASPIPTPTATPVVRQVTKPVVLPSVGAKGGVRP